MLLYYSNINFIFIVQDNKNINKLDAVRVSSAVKFITTENQHPLKFRLQFYVSSTFSIKIAIRSSIGSQKTIKLI